METPKKAPARSRLVIKSGEHLLVWIAGLIFGLWGFIGLLFFPSAVLVLRVMHPILAVSGVVMLFLYPKLTIVADRPTRTLRLEYRYLLFRRTRKIPFDDIAAIRSEYSHHIDSDGHSSSGYRLVAELVDGRTIPFRTSFGDADPRDATRLQTFIRRSQSSDEGPTEA